MCKKLTGRSNANTLALAEHLSERGTKMWIRHVLVPGWTLEEGALRRTAAFIQKLDHVEKVEILPYHEMGVYKWEALGLDYPLKGTKPPTSDEVEWAEGILQGTV
jgi:pyruvate formate lyase activating enzyme